MESFERVARAAAEEAGMLLRANWLESKTVRYKGAVDIVTETDHEAETLIVSRLQQAFPDHIMIAEEAAGGSPLSPPQANRHAWYIDPVDGTTNFAHAYPHFAVSVALGLGAELLFGIVYDPLRNETFTARRGQGAALNGKPIGVSTIDDLGHALIATGFPYDRRQNLDFYLAFLADFIVCAQGIRRNGSAALDLCYVACGRLDAFFEWKLHPWDTAAGALIVREAQGTVSDFGGQPFDLYGPQMLASNGHLHPAMVRVLSTRLERIASEHEHRGGRQ